MSRRAKAKRVGEDGTKDGKPASDDDKGSRNDANTLTEWVKSLAVAFVLFIFLRSFVVQTFVITSGSMEDTLLVGDMLVVNRAALGSRIPFTSLRIPGYSDARRGDVIVFDPHHEEDMKLPGSITHPMRPRETTGDPS
ncbi:MAG: signal peptidase I [Gemmatimonadota bacterium]